MSAMGACCGCGKTAPADRISEHTSWCPAWAGRYRQDSEDPYLDPAAEWARRQAEPEPDSALTGQVVGAARKAAEDRAERIAANLAAAAQDYAQAILDKDWLVMGLTPEQWRARLFGDKRLTVEGRRQVAGLLSGEGMSERQIMQATGEPKTTVHRDLGAVQSGPPALTSQDVTHVTPEPKRKTGARRVREHRQRKRAEAGSAPVPAGEDTAAGAAEGAGGGDSGRAHLEQLLADRSAELERARAEIARLRAEVAALDGDADYECPRCGELEDELAGAREEIESLVRVGRMYAEGRDPLREAGEALRKRSAAPDSQQEPAPAATPASARTAPDSQPADGQAAPEPEPQTEEEWLAQFSTPPPPVRATPPVTAEAGDLFEEIMRTA